jgi:hypothetical protein
MGSRTPHSRPRPDKFEAKAKAKARQVRGQAETKIDVTRPVSTKNIYTRCTDMIYFARWTMELAISMAIGL